MRQLHHLTVVLTLILSLLAPTMVCALPNAQMTASEHACCKKMKGDCGGMRMPASHSCCQPSMQANNFDAVQPESASAAVAVLPSPTIFNLPSLSLERVRLQQHSRPISPPPTVSVLRI
jgi:hypothetical protein